MYFCTVAITTLTSKIIPAQGEFSIGFSLHRVLLIHSCSIEVPIECPRIVFAQWFHAETVCIQTLGRSIGKRGLGKQETKENRRKPKKIQNLQSYTPPILKCLSILCGVQSGHMEQRENGKQREMVPSLKSSIWKYFKYFPSPTLPHFTNKTKQKTKRSFDEHIIHLVWIYVYIHESTDNYNRAESSAVKSFVPREPLLQLHRNLQ